MKQSFGELINQSFTFPDPQFSLNQNGWLQFGDLDLQSLIKEYGSPLRITSLPAIRQQIAKARTWFADATKAEEYKGDYHYCYCTKSNHFSHVLSEALKEKVHIETSSAFDLHLIEKLYLRGEFSKKQMLVCNGYKNKEYLSQIARLGNLGFNILPVIDVADELEVYEGQIIDKLSLGIRIATEEEPQFEFYTSRLGVPYSQLHDLVVDKILPNPKFELKMLHFFFNQGINDHPIYWAELRKAIVLYCKLKKVCPELSLFNIGGGLPFRDNLDFDFDYADIIRRIVKSIKETCDAHQVECPDIVTEFGKFTVANSGALLFKVLGQKRQNDKEIWYMVDNSLMCTLPDIFGIQQRFILLPLNHWDKGYQRANVGGLSCDQYDYYNSEVHQQQVYLPKVEAYENLYIGFFNMGAYQEAMSGYGGIKHCLIPSPKHILVDEKGKVQLLKENQSADQMLKILGYEE